MKEKHSFFLSLVVLTPLLNSCSSLFYRPNSTPIPLFKNEGDMFLEASTDLRNSYDIKYGFVTQGNEVKPPVAVYFGFGGSELNYSQTDTLNGNTFTRNCSSGTETFNMGFGGFIEETYSKNFRLEAFIDMALGGFNNKVNGDSPFLKGHFSRLGALINLGYTTTDNKLSYAYSARFSRIHFYDISGQGNIWKEDINKLYHTGHYNVLMHSIMFRYGFKNIKLEAQGSLSQGLYPASEKNAIPRYNMNFSLGVFINFNIFGAYRDQ